MSPSHGREITKISCIKMASFCTLNAIIVGGGVGYVKWHIHVPTPTSPIYIFVFTTIGGGGGLALVPLSYASANGAARICQPRVKARERSDRALGGGGGGPLPR